MFGDACPRSYNLKVSSSGSMVSLESFPNEGTRKRHPNLSGDSRQPHEVFDEFLMLLSGKEI
jgi:hypothetical protein